MFQGYLGFPFCSLMHIYKIYCTVASITAQIVECCTNNGGKMANTEACTDTSTGTHIITVKCSFLSILHFRLWVNFRIVLNKLEMFVVRWHLGRLPPNHEWLDTWVPSKIAVSWLASGNCKQTLQFHHLPGTDQGHCLRHPQNAWLTPPLHYFVVCSCNCTTWLHYCLMPFKFISPWPSSSA